MKFNVGIRGNDGHLPQVVQNLCPVCGPITLNDDRDFGPPHSIRIGESLVFQDIWLVLVNVNIKFAIGQ